jgi:CO dehydrogenase maturation factor
VRGVLGGLVAEGERVTVVDLEAGLEHLSRGTARHVDTLLLVGEPYFKSLEMVDRAARLAGDLGIKRVQVVANKIRTSRDSETVGAFVTRHGLALAGEVPYDDAVVEADRAGVALVDHRPDAPSVAAIRRLADRVLAA